MERIPAVYILTNARNGTLYTGVTSDLPKRIWQHRNGQGSGFTSRYKLTQLVYYEVYEDMYNAIAREKQIKNWKRAWKIELIETMNPDWADLYRSII